MMTFIDLGILVKEGMYVELSDKYIDDGEELILTMLD